MRTCDLPNAVIRDPNVGHHVKGSGDVTFWIDMYNSAGPYLDSKPFLCLGCVPNAVDEPMTY